MNQEMRSSRVNLKSPACQVNQNMVPSQVNLVSPGNRLMAMNLEHRVKVQTNQKKNRS